MYIVCYYCVVVSQGFQVILNVMDVQWVVLQWGFVVNDLSGIQGDVVQLYCVFGYGVQMFGQCGMEVIQYFVYGDKVCIVYILVCLFGDK